MATVTAVGTVIRSRMPLNGKIHRVDTVSRRKFERMHEERIGYMRLHAIRANGNSSALPNDLMCWGENKCNRIASSGPASNPDLSLRDGNRESLSALHRKNSGKPFRKWDLPRQECAGTANVRTEMGNRRNNNLENLCVRAPNGCVDPSTKPEACRDADSQGAKT